MSGISSDAFNKLSSDIISRINPSSLLDIGPGQGKYGKLARRLSPGCVSTAIELSNTYQEVYSLNSVYDMVIVGDCVDIIDDPAWRNKTFDLVVIGDCIEHLPKSRGLDLLNFLTYRCGYLLVIAPEFCWYDTNLANMEYSESHISVWSEFDFQWHDLFAFQRSEIMQFFLLRGYQNAKISLSDLVRESNAAEVPISNVSGSLEYKFSKLEIRSRERTELIDGTVWSYRHA